MLQIIGWLGCMYFVVKGLEITGRSDSYVPRADNPEKSEMRGFAAAAVLLAYATAFAFGIWLLLAGSAMSEVAKPAIESTEHSSFQACLDAADTVEEIQACG